MPYAFNLTYLWLVLAIGLSIVEISTTSLVCIWFVVGSLFAFAISFITKSLGIQLLAFVLVSGASLAITKPLVKKYLNKAPVPTNMDMLIGKTCFVTEDILPDKKGRVKIDGLTWLAQSNFPLRKGEECIIVKIIGATLMVSPKAVQKV